MDLISIGEAARQLGLATSTLRYYEERGLVRPAARRGGRRMYGRDELRRLAFLRMAQSFGLSLDAAADMLDRSGEPWRDVVRGQIAALQKLVARARGAQAFLAKALDCPARHPTAECPHLLEALDRLVAGTTVEQLAAGFAPYAVQPGNVSEDGGPRLIEPADGHQAHADQLVRPGKRG